jgi:hypothetical protein
MIGRVPHLPFLVGIVIAASGCDNVSWGGIDLRLEGPSDDTTLARGDTARGPGDLDPAAALGPLLYAGARSGDRVEVVPVAEITGAGLRPLPSGPEGEELDRQIIQGRLRHGRELILFHQGVRVGALVVDDTGMERDTYCQSRPWASGPLILLPGAFAAERFLALERAEGIFHPFGPFRELSSEYDQRVASLNLGSEAVTLVGAPWPPSLLDIRQDLQILDLTGGEAPAVMATFLHRDQLQVGPAPDDAYALLVLGEPTGPRFDLTYVWYRPVSTEGKGAPRYFSRMDWDGDGQEEVLLEVLGADRRWFAAIDRAPEGWQTVFQDPCGTPGSQGGGG